MFCAEKYQQQALLIIHPNVHQTGEWHKLKFIQILKVYHDISKQQQFICIENIIVGGVMLWYSNWPNHPSSCGCDKNLEFFFIFQIATFNLPSSYSNIFLFTLKTHNLNKWGVNYMWSQSNMEWVNVKKRWLRFMSFFFSILIVVVWVVPLEIRKGTKIQK